jgi:hypothetical protein
LATPTISRGQRIASAGRGGTGPEAVSGVLHEQARVTAQQPLDVEVELVERGPPLAISHRRSPHRRVDDVGEEDGGQESRRRVRAAPAGDEFLDLVDDGVELARPRQDVRARDGDEARSRDVLGEIAAVLDEVAGTVGA